MAVFSGISDAAVYAMLNATLQHPGSRPCSAESALSEAELVPGFIPALFRLATSPNPPNPSIPLVAAVYLKNLVRREWHQPDAVHSKSALPDQDRAYLRASIVPVMPEVDTKVRAQLIEALKRIISADFPARFPLLLPLIQTALRSDELHVVEAGLVVLRALAKVYEFKGATLASRAQSLSEESSNGVDWSTTPGGNVGPDWEYLHRHPRVALNFVVRETFPRLLEIMNALNATVEADKERHRVAPISGSTKQSSWAPETVLTGDKPHELQRTICKIFWSFTQYDLPEYLVYDLSGAFSQWMNTFLGALQTPVPRVAADGLLPSNDQLRRMPQWKVKQWIGHIVYRLLQRYSNPSCLNPSLLRHFDIKTLTAFGDFFRRTFAAAFTSAMLDILFLDQRYISPRVANLALLYLESAVSPSITYRVMKPRLDHLISKVIFPYLCISDFDLSLWTDDPIEYVRKAYDVLEDFNTPRAAACTLLLNLAKLRSSAVVSPLLNFLVDILDCYADEYQSLLRSFESGIEPNPDKLGRVQLLARQKDGALLAIGTIRETLLSNPQNSNYLEAVLNMHVISEFQSKFPFLRARACWLYGQVIASESVSTDVVLLGLAGVQKCLSDEEFPVRVRAAVDIRHFMHNYVAAEQIAPKILDLLALLFTLLDDIDSTDIVATIDQVVVGFSDRIAPFAGPLCARLVDTFSRAASAGEGDDEAGFAAAQCIQALESIVTAVALSSVSNKIVLLAEIERTVAEIFDHMFEENRIEYFEDALELLAIFVHHSANERGAHVRMCVDLGVEPHQASLGLAKNRSESPALQISLDGKDLRLAMEADTAAGRGVISPYLWSLFPRALDAFHDWAFDYSFHYVHLVEAYLSRATRVFMLNQAGSASSMQLLLGMIGRLWDDSCLEEEDFATQGGRLCGLLLQHGRHVNGISVEHESGILTQLAVLRLRASSESLTAVTALLRSLAHLIFVSPGTALEVIDKSLGYTREIFDLWMSLVQDGKLGSRYDRKCSAIALTTILSSDWAVLPSVLRQAVPRLLLAVVKLLDSLEHGAGSRKSSRNEDKGDEYANGQNSVLHDGRGGCMFPSEYEGERSVTMSFAGHTSDVFRAAGQPSEKKNMAGESEMQAEAGADMRDGNEEWGGIGFGEENERGVQDGENPLFCILDDVDELLYFERVVRQLPGAAVQQLMTAFASDETRRIQCTLHRAAELRNGMVSSMAKV